MRKNENNTHERDFSSGCGQLKWQPQVIMVVWFANAGANAKPSYLICTYETI